MPTAAVATTAINPLDHIGLVKTRVLRFVEFGSPLWDDLVQEGMIGVIVAARRFDPDRGTTFACFAVPWIDGTIQHYLRDKTDIPRFARKKNSFRVCSLNAVSDSGIELIDRIRLADPRVEDEDLLALKDAIDKLEESEPVMARCLRMMASEGLRYEEISQNLGVGKVTVYRRIKAGTIKLKQLLEVA